MKQMHTDTEEGEPQSRSVVQEMFEDEENEVNSAKPYCPIVQELDLPFGTTALKIAFPRVPLAVQNTAIDISPKMLQENLVVAIACADSTVRLLTLPLMPPSPQSKNRLDLDLSLSKTGRGSWGEQLIVVPIASGSQSLLKSISVAFMPRSMSPDEDEMDAEERDQDQVDQKQTSREEEWVVLIASCGSDQSSELLIHKIPVSEDGTTIEEETTSHDLLWRNESLVRSVAAIDLYVPTQAAPEQSPYILLAETNGNVRVYDCCASSTNRRGCWIVCLYPGYEAKASGRVRYRSLLDAKWVLGGSAIAVVMADGEWGIWDLGFNRANGLNTEKLLPISAGIRTQFTLNGWISGPAVVASTAKSSTGKLESRSKLAPMTPHTRKVRQDALFIGSATHSSASTSGGIHLLPTGTAFSGQEEDETLLVWSGDRITLIPSLFMHWQTKVEGSGNLFGTNAAGRPRDISSIDVGGEFRTAVSIFPPRADRSLSEVALRHPDVLVSGDRSLFVLASPLHEPARSTAYNLEPAPMRADQQLLSRGELDVNGMDRILVSMSNGQQLSSTRMNGTATKRKVGFAGSR